MKRRSPIAVAIAISSLAAFAPAAGFAASADSQGETIAMYAVGSRDAPKSTALAPVSAQICRKASEPSPTDAEAIAAVQSRARAIGADQIINVDFYRQEPGPAPRASVNAPFWQEIIVTGMAATSGEMREASK